MEVFLPQQFYKNMNNKIFLTLLLSTFILSGCSTDLPSNLFLSNPSNNKINNLIDANQDNKSDLVFWNSSSMSSSSKFLEPCFFHSVGLGIGIKKSPNIKLGDFGDFPFIGYFDEDNILDYGIIRSNSQGRTEWFIKKGNEDSGYSIPLGKVSDYPCPADVDGDGRTDAVVYESENNTFRGFTSKTGSGFEVSLGSKGDIPILKDFDGDGLADFTTYNPTTGVWNIKASTSSQVSTLNIGGESFYPIPADYDGDTKADFVAWNYRDNSIKGYLTKSQSLISDQILDKIKNTLGNKKYIPVSLDYDGDKKSEIAFWDESLKLLLTFDVSNGFKKTIYRLPQAKNSKLVSAYLFDKFFSTKKPSTLPIQAIRGNPNILFLKEGSIKGFDLIKKSVSQITKAQKTEFRKNYTPFLSDFDLDGISDLCFWSNNTGAFIINSSRVGWKFALPLGLNIDLPVIGNFNNDQIPDIAVYRKGLNSFYVRFLGRFSPSETEKITVNFVSQGNSVPKIGDYDGDYIDDFAIFDFDKNTFLVRESSGLNQKEYKFAGETLFPLTGDFDGDEKVDPAVISFKTQEIIFASSKSNDQKKILINLPDFSGNIFTVKLDQDFVSDIVFVNTQSGEINLLLSLSNYKVSKFKVDSLKNAILVNQNI